MLGIRYFLGVAVVLLNFSNTNAQLKSDRNDLIFGMAKEWAADANANDFTWRKAKDKWTTDDKGFHAFGSAYLYSLLAKKMPKGYAALTTIALGAAWEVKDAYVKFEVVPILGGDGFSKKDLVFDVGGVGLGLLRDLLFTDKNSKANRAQRAKVNTRGN